MKDIELAKARLPAGAKMAAAKGGKIVFESKSGGVRGMHDALMSGADLKGSSIADTVVGKAAAMMCAHAGAKEIYARLISDSAIAYLEAKGIGFSFSGRVERILNRDRTDLCPFEKMAESSGTEEELIGKVRLFFKAAPTKSQ